MSAPAVRVLEHQYVAYRRTWRGSVFQGFLAPVLFLGAMGIGLGSFVDRSGAGLLQGVPYLAFLGPGLLAATAMQTAAFESMYPVLAGIMWIRSYHGMLATPIGVRDIVAGILGWTAIRLTLVASIFVAVIVVMGVARSPGVVFAVPAAVLTGMAFAAPITAFTATQDTDDAFPVLFRFAITPLFLFSGTFFPIERLPAALQPIAYLTPLYHGVTLTRGLSLGTLDLPGVLVHGGVLAVIVVAGFAAARRTFERRLVR